MPTYFRHFAINADDVQRAKSFYEAAFGWAFDPWGPPDFYQVRDAGPGVVGHLQERRELKPGAKMLGYEPSLGVEDLTATIAAVEAAGGKIIGQPYTIEGVGRLVYFEDTEGNLVGAMQYDKDYEKGAFG